MKLTVNTKHVAIVFGYGSLMSAESRSQQVTEDNYQIGKLKDFRRRFNATGLSNSSRNLKYFVMKEEISELEMLPNFLPVYLNIEPEPGHEMVGCYFPVTSDQLREVRAREANYDMVDVSAHVADDIQTEGLPVLAAIAKPAARVRTMDARAFIAAPYWELCLAAHKETDIAHASWNMDALFEDFMPQILNVALPKHLKGY